MSYEIRPYKLVDLKNIKLGKTFKYGDNYNLTNIYYLETNTELPKESISRRQDTIDEKSKLIIQTPIMYIPNSMIYFNEKPYLELSFNNQENDDDVKEFSEWILKLEDMLIKLIKRRSTLKLDKMNFVSIIKTGFKSNKLIVPINLNISKCILSDDGKKNKFLFNWEIPVPTYGISIIWIKNIWIKNGKWGINLFMYASRVMNSHILDPIDFLGENIDNKNIKTIDVIKQFTPNEKMSITISQVPDYSMFFRMLKMGIPSDAIKQKMTLAGVDIRIIDYPPDTPYVTVLHYLSNPHLKYQKDTMQSGIPPPPPMFSGGIPLPPPLPNFNVQSTNTIRSGLLNQINGGNFTLKKVDKEQLELDKKQKIVDKLSSQSGGMKVPSLTDIQGALSRLKKVDIDQNDQSDI